MFNYPSVSRPTVGCKTPECILWPVLGALLHNDNHGPAKKEQVDGFVTENKNNTTNVYNVLKVISAYCALTI